MPSTRGPGPSTGGSRGSRPGSRTPRRRPRRHGLQHDLLAADRLRERLPLGQELRRLPDENVADILESGLFGVMKPKHYGGSELGTQTMIDVTIELASADPSTGWVYMLWTAHMWLQALWPKRAMDEMWENPNTLASSVVSTAGNVEKVEGGYRWTGRGFFSHSADCTRRCSRSRTPVRY